MDALIQKLSKLKTARPNLVKLLESLFIPVSFRKGTELGAPEYSFPVIYFIETGLLRGFFVYEQQEYTNWIMSNGFLLSSGSFFSEEPALEYIEFLENSSGWLLNLAKAELLAQTEPLLYRILLEIYEENLHNRQKLELMLRLKDAKDRFLYVKKHNESLLYKVINRVLGSFLKIEDKYLYTIKKKYKS